jgi:signal transduction histidine kinase
MRVSSYGRSAASSATTQTLSAVQAQPPATVRRTAPNVQAMLRQLRGELDAAGVTVTLRLDGDDTSMPPQIKSLVLRTLEVAVDNVLAHAHAKTVSVVVEIRCTDAQVEVLDDGVGLWDGTAEPPGYHQIKRLRYRVEEVGGALRVEERPDGGVAVCMQVPLDTPSL